MAVESGIDEVLGTVDVNNTITEVMEVVGDSGVDVDVVTTV